jgi:phosphopantetheinyl transferase
MTGAADATTTVTVAVVVPGEGGEPTADLVPAGERDRIARLRRADDQWSARAAWAVAAGIVAGRLGVEPATLVVDRTCGRCGSDEHGKPQFRGSGLHLSLSHTRGCAVVAVSPGFPVGVDVEPTAADRWPPGEDARTWTVREAVLKCRGVGLGAPWESALADGLQVLALAVPAAYVATLAVQTDGPVDVVYRRVLTADAP